MKILKKIAPKTLYGRFLLITTIPIIVLQLVISYIFYENHWNSMSRNMASSLSGEVALVVDAFSFADNEQRDKIIITTKALMDLDIDFTNDKILDKHSYTKPEHLKYKSSLQRFFKNPVTVTYDKEQKKIITQILISDGTLIIKASHKRLASPTTYIFIMWMVGTAILLLGIAILFIRGQIRSIIRLARAAEKFGKGQDSPDFKPQGAKEIRLAAVAFIQMRERIKRLLNRRTQMLAGVSHDLRTPLTRMKLQLQLMKQNSDTKALKEDVSEMEKMLEGYLDFARGEPEEKTISITVSDFFNDFLSSYRNQSAHIKNNISSNKEIKIRPQSLRRAFSNIIDNALHYGTNTDLQTEITKDNQISIIIDDDGIGIDENQYENVFQAFYRVDSSRNNKTGGVGLGLSITRDIINRHGGDIKLGKSPQGGLRVIVTLPL